VVGRVKIEERPLLLVEAQTTDGQRHSVLLQVPVCFSSFNDLFE
jgi:3-dehydroquinate synthase class II